MRIKDRIEFQNKPAVLSFKPNDKVIDAVKVMSDRNYGASIIVDNDNKPLGIVTERDFMRRLVAKGLDANTTAIADIMTSELRLAQAEDDVVDWLRIMSNERFRHVPVVDKQGKLINLMSQGDFVSYTWPQLLMRLKDNTVKTFMERFNLHLLVLGIMTYSIIMVLAIRHLSE